MTTGQKIANLRKEHSMTQPILAEKMNVSQSTITSWENDRRGISNEDLIKLSDLFGVTTDYLLGINHTPKNATPQETKDLHRILGQGQLTYREEPVSKEAQDAVKALLEGYYWSKGRNRVKHDDNSNKE